MPDWAEAVKDKRARMKVKIGSKVVFMAGKSISFCINSGWFKSAVFAYDGFNAGLEVKLAPNQQARSESCYIIDIIPLLSRFQFKSGCYRQYLQVKAQIY
jgi:hypothetical protein